MPLALVFDHSAEHIRLFLRFGSAFVNVHLLHNPSYGIKKLPMRGSTQLAHLLETILSQIRYISLQMNKHETRWENGDS